jgi:Zn ribbon nucleic-acid-binding protein
MRYILRMSFLLEQEMECPACKYPNSVEVWSVVNVKEDPELKDILLGGELNMAECVSCKHVFYAEHFIIYHESDRELMAFVYTLANRDDAETWKAKTATDFAAFQENAGPDNQLKYKPVTLFGLDELVQLVQKEEEMNIQADIVKALSDENHFAVKTLRPGQARELGLPVVLPLSDDTSLDLRERVKQGVEKLLQTNDLLFVYRQLLKELNDGQHVRLDI